LCFLGFHSRPAPSSPMATVPHVATAAKAITRPDPHSAKPWRTTPPSGVPHPWAFPIPCASNPDKPWTGRHGRDLNDGRGRGRVDIHHVRSGCGRNDRGRRVGIGNMFMSHTSGHQQSAARDGLDRP
jgi:hypothetical protein